MDDHGNNLSIIHWTPLFRKDNTKLSLGPFADHFFHVAVSLLIINIEPRIDSEIKRILHLSEKTKKGEWYMYQSYSEIRIYGCELSPYKLPKYVPIRIFALEFIRKMINMDQIHFQAAKKKSNFKLKTQVGPFICNTRATRQDANV